jgi:hypothetical protein
MDMVEPVHGIGHISALDMKIDSVVRNSNCVRIIASYDRDICVLMTQPFLSQWMVQGFRSNSEESSRPIFFLVQVRTAKGPVAYKSPSEKDKLLKRLALSGKSRETNPCQEWRHLYGSRSQIERRWATLPAESAIQHPQSWEKALFQKR